MRTLLILLLLTTNVFALGETEITIENLKRDIRTPLGLSRWMQIHLQYREFANDGTQLKTERHPCFKTGVADCDDYAILANDWLEAHHLYTPYMVEIYSPSNNGKGHIVTIFWGGGQWYMFDNDNLMTLRGKNITYQSLARSCYSNWSLVMVNKKDLEIYRITRKDKPIPLGG